MRPAALFLPAVTLAACLSGCSRTTDTFAPRITIISPSDGGVSQTKSPTVRGYAFDDVGVTQITVNGKNISILPGSRKIANFEFKASVTGASAEYQLAAYDAAGNVGKLTLPITVDTVKPELSIKTFERSGKTIRVSGVATDNTEVAQVIVDGNRLNINPGKRVEFYAETTGIYADIEVSDAAGNTAKLRAQ